MFGTLKTLLTGANARAEENLRDQYAIELIEQKIRETETNLKAAKSTLASMIQRQRSEQRQVEGLDTRIQEMTSRARQALNADNEALAAEAAQAIATMENELTLRRETDNRLKQKVLRLRQSVETANRRLIDLKQGAISARAVRNEQRMQMKLRDTGTISSAADEAETLIQRVLERDDPFERSEILQELNDDLSMAGLEDRMADAGFGPNTRATAQDVLKKLKSDLK